MEPRQNPLRNLVEYRDLEDAIRNKRGPVMVTDLSDVSKAHFISSLLHSEKNWKLVLTYEENKAKQIYEDIQTFEENVLLYPAKDFLFFYADIHGHRITKERIAVWKAISEANSGVVITTIDGLMDKLEDIAKLKSSVIEIRGEDVFKPEELAKKLSEIGYERLPQVEGVGQFSVRGGIVDVFPITYENPVRIELWDEEIDSMRSFDISSQRSLETVEMIRIFPAKEKELGGQNSFLRFFDVDNSMMILDEPLRLYDRAVEVENEFRDSIEERLLEGKMEKSEIPEIFSAKEVMQDLNAGRAIGLSALGHGVKVVEFREVFSVRSRALPSYKNSYDLLISDLKKYTAQRFMCVLLIPSRTRVERIVKNLLEEGVDAYAGGGEAVGKAGLLEEDATKTTETKPLSDWTTLSPARVLVAYGNVAKSFEYTDLKFVVISENDMADAGSIKKKKRFAKKKSEQSKISSLSELSVGNYVIHEDFGLGRYLGIEQIERNGAIRDYIKLEYQGGDKCYVPTAKLDRIQKYGGNTDRPVKLGKMGGREWANTKARAKSAIENIARDLVELYSNRLNKKGHVYRKDGDWQREFEEVFPYEETADQMKAIEDVKSDMEQGKIMDRLICGDVGYGKTEIALRAAFKAIQEGKQVIYLVPTTILAQQHYNTFVQRMKDFPVKVGLMCRFRTPAQQKATLDEFHKGFVDVLIGTHRVLSKDIRPRDLGLIIVDEEQRFGVTHKEKLKKLKEDVNVMTLTATPIPRTLHMSLAGIRDLSILEEPPIDRKPIQTYVMEYQNYTVKEAIKRELARGGQVYYVYNRVTDIDEVTENIRALVPDAVVEYAHGKMNERDLEEIILDFINGEIDVLVSTTIIETGLDIPNANTMIIQDADKLGLSQLYQLRGRIGRSSRTSYAFLMYKREMSLSDEAQARLKAIKEFTELGSGIKIAMRDLEIRGAGNVLGAQQHGHMQAVGYELYCKLLNHAVRALRGESVEEAEFETTVDLSMDAYIPSSYISNEEQKLDMYKRIASIESLEDYLDMQDELMDRFGEIKPPVLNLVKVSYLKSMAHRVYAKDVNISAQEVVFVMMPDAKIKVENIASFVEEYRHRLKLRRGNQVEFVYTEPQKQSDCRPMLEKALEIAENMVEKLL